MKHTSGSRETDWHRIKYRYSTGETGNTDPASAQSILKAWQWIRQRVGQGEWVVTLLGGHGGRAGAVEVDILPLAVAAVPDAGLLWLHGARHAAAVDVLGEADVGDAGGLVPNQVDVGVEQDGVDRLLGLGQSWRGKEHRGWRKMHTAKNVVWQFLDWRLTSVSVTQTISEIVCVTETLVNKFQTVYWNLGVIFIVLAFIAVCTNNTVLTTCCWDCWGNTMTLSEHIYWRSLSKWPQTVFVDLMCFVLQAFPHYVADYNIIIPQKKDKTKYVWNWNVI